VRASPHALLVTGAPGVGKTTLLRRVAAMLGERRLARFTTEEVRERGQRVGFRIAPHGGRARIMAHVEFEPPRVGRYGVDVPAIDAIAEETLCVDPAVSVYVVDEIGKMECLSPRFVARMRALLDSDRRVVASVARRGGGFIEEAKARPDVELWEISPRNRDALVERILEWLRADRPDATAGHSSAPSTGSGR
jgi:nucleoside-triphosphatase